jgi:hypothetical protein
LRVWLTLDGDIDGSSSSRSSGGGGARSSRTAGAAPHGDDSASSSDDDEDLRFGALQALGEGGLGAGVAGEDGERLVILKAAAQARRLLVDCSVEAVEVELVRPPASSSAAASALASAPQRSGTGRGSVVAPTGSGRPAPLAAPFATLVVRGLVLTGRVDADGFVRRQQRHARSGGAAPAATGEQDGAVVVRERHQATGTRTVKASVAYFVVLNHLDPQVVLADEPR